MLWDFKLAIIDETPQTLLSIQASLRQGGGIARVSRRFSASERLIKHTLLQRQCCPQPRLCYVESGYRTDWGMATQRGQGWRMLGLVLSVCERAGDCPCVEIEGCGECRCLRSDHDTFWNWMLGTATLLLTKIFWCFTARDLSHWITCTLGHAHYARKE